MIPPLDTHRDRPVEQVVRDQKLHGSVSAQTLRPLVGNLKNGIGEIYPNSCHLYKV
jgi:hypothetical protein